MLPDQYNTHLSYKCVKIYQIQNLELLFFVFQKRIQISFQLFFFGLQKKLQIN
ncbi:hypothetical protein LEP1GSC120_2632 [Leptospira santarosai str. 200702252]|nr:hypothetical protein LEP1GSC068_1355 [Leptospira sp. Fiocruz LV3954]EMI63089.1 hypothetical protein LEP1GSC076_0805 [Leptospira sp. Fiocruz LV4135]EMP00043.1 hypothetical protein LEP1GSC120_2632 [Leptospira santarosai str. 200702252]